jgi:hypothetical protein
VHLKSFSHKDKLNLFLSLRKTDEVSDQYSTTGKITVLCILISVSIPQLVIQKYLKTGEQLTPWNRVLLEKLTVTQLVKKFPAFYGSQRFVTVFITASY